MGGKNKKRKLHAQRDTPQKKHIAPSPVSKSSSKSATNISKPVDPTIPFEAEDHILLVGEGDFTFAKSIVQNHGCYDVTATCLDSRSELFEKYNPQAEANVKYLEDEGQSVLYNVDATKLDQNKGLRKQGGQFNTVMFNFPHVGGKSTNVNRQVRFNQELLVKFFTAAIPILTPAGTVVVTLFEGEPYTLWNIRDLARHTGLEVQRSFKFLSNAYPGYSHARTLGNIQGGGGWKGEDRESRSYVFQKKKDTNDDVPSGRQARRNRKKRPREQESSDEEW